MVLYNIYIVCCKLPLIATYLIFSRSIINFCEQPVKVVSRSQTTPFATLRGLTVQLLSVISRLPVELYDHVIVTYILKIPRIHCKYVSLFHHRLTASTACLLSVPPSFLAASSELVWQFIPSITTVTRGNMSRSRDHSSTGSLEITDKSCTAQRR